MGQNESRNNGVPPHIRRIKQGQHINPSQEVTYTGPEPDASVSSAGTVPSAPSHQQGIPNKVPSFSTAQQNITNMPLLCSPTQITYQNPLDVVIINKDTQSSIPVPNTPSLEECNERKEIKTPIKTESMKNEECDVKEYLNIGGTPPNIKAQINVIASLSNTTPDNIDPDLLKSDKLNIDKSLSNQNSTTIEYNFDLRDIKSTESPSLRIDSEKNKSKLSADDIITVNQDHNFSCSALSNKTPLYLDSTDLVPEKVQVPTNSPEHQLIKCMPNEKQFFTKENVSGNEKEVVESTMCTERDDILSCFSSFNSDTSVKDMSNTCEIFMIPEPSHASSRSTLIPNQMNVFTSAAESFVNNWQSLEKCSVDSFLKKADGMANINKLQDRKNKRNLSKIVGLRNLQTKSSSKTLRHFEKLAEGLCNTSNNYPTTIHVEEPATLHTSLYSGTKDNNDSFSHFSKKESQRNSSLEDSIFQMTNLEVENKEMVISLQKLVLKDLQVINNFLSVLKQCPISSEKQIMTEINTMAANLSSFASENQPSEHAAVFSALKLPNKISSVRDTESTHKNPFTTNARNCNTNINEFSLPNLCFKRPKESNCKPSTFENMSNGPKDTNTIQLNSFRSLLDELPDELKHEKQNISLKNTQFYCRVCEKSIVLAMYNLIAHLKGKCHQKMLTEVLKLGLPDSTEPIHEDPIHEDVLNKDFGLALKDTDSGLEVLALPPNYKGVLDIVYNSHEKGLVLNISLYVCRSCDFLANNQEDAMNHLNDANHKKYQLMDANWHFCNSCSINIYGNLDHIKEHDKTSQHLNVIQIKNSTVNEKSPIDNHLPKTDEELDCVSICSSKSDLSSRGNKRLKPHEILLSLVKDNKKKNNGGSLGLFCSICNRYTLYDSKLPDHFETEKHKSMLLNVRNIKKCETYFCHTCQVDVFGDVYVLKEHTSLLLHKQMADSEKQLDKSDVQEKYNSDDALCNLSDEDGPHFDCMKAVLKKHLTYEPATSYYGFFCHLCETFSLNETDWKAHIGTTSHFNRINAIEYRKEKMLHECLMCNICLISNEHFFSLHKRSLAHQVISRQRERVKSANVVKQKDDESNKDKSEDDNEILEDEFVIVDGSDNQSTSSNQNCNNRGIKNKRKIVRNGIHIKGLPPNVEQKDVFNIFKSFGFIKTCTVDKANCSSNVTFQKISEAEKVLQMRDVRVRNKAVSITQLFELRQIKETCELNAEVAAALKSFDRLLASVEHLQNEIVNEGLHRERKSGLIKQDILATVPGSKVHLFGSQVTGLATSISDFDIYIDFDNRSFFTELPHDQQLQIIHLLLNKFTQPQSKFQVKEPVLDARVPIIKVVHLETNTLCDISCKSGLSVENSQLIRVFIQSDHRVRWLVITVKWWMRANGLLDRTIFTSYATTWLVFFFLMRLREPLLCSIAHLQKGCREYSIAHWDCRFDRDIHKRFKSVNKQSRFDLLAHFFIFYSSFSFHSTVLCPLTASVIPRNNFDELRVPPAYIPYVRKVQLLRNPEKLRTTTPICLQDPFDLAHNMTKGVSREHLTHFKTLCLQSAKICENITRN